MAIPRGRAKPSRVVSPRPWKALTETSSLALLVSVSLFARQIIHLDDESYRNFFEPPPYYRLALILDVFLVAVMATMTGAMVQRFGPSWLQRAFTRIFFLVLGSSLLGTIPLVENHPAALLVIWSLLAVFLFATWIMNHDAFVSPFKRLCLILTPAGPLVLLQLATWSAFEPSPSGSRIALANPTPSVPIYIMLFDEWSYPRTIFEENGSRPKLPNFHAFASRSFDFQNAHSEDKSTAYSIPHFLFQTRRKLDFRKRRFVLEGDVNLPVTSQTPSLLKMAHEHGYKTAIAGWHLPYAKLFGDQADEVLTPTPWPAFPGFPGAMLRGFAENLRYSNDPVFRVARQLMIIREGLWKTQDMEQKCLKLIDRSESKTFAFLHLPLPHDPFIYVADGSHANVWIDETSTSYIQQLEYTDKVLGRLLKRIKDHKAFDKALVIVMSDHAWRGETDPRIALMPRSLLKVPLLVKWPGQSRTRVVNSPVITTKAGDLIRLAMEGGAESDAKALIESWSKPVPTQR